MDGQEKGGILKQWSLRDDLPKYVNVDQDGHKAINGCLLDSSDLRLDDLTPGFTFFGIRDFDSLDETITGLANIFVKGLDVKGSIDYEVKYPEYPVIEEEWRKLKEPESQSRIHFENEVVERLKRVNRIKKNPLLMTRDELYDSMRVRGNLLDQIRGLDFKKRQMSMVKDKYPSSKIVFDKKDFPIEVVEPINIDEISDEVRKDIGLREGESMKVDRALSFVITTRVNIPDFKKQRLSKEKDGTTKISVVDRLFESQIKDRLTLYNFIISREDGEKDVGLGLKIDNLVNLNVLKKKKEESYEYREISSGLMRS